MLAGNLASIGVGGIVAVVYSLIVSLPNQQDAFPVGIVVRC